MQQRPIVAESDEFGGSRRNEPRPESANAHGKRGVTTFVPRRSRRLSSLSDGSFGGLSGSDSTFLGCLRYGLSCLFEASLGKVRRVHQNPFFRLPSPKLESSRLLFWQGESLTFMSTNGVEPPSKTCKASPSTATSPPRARESAQPATPMPAKHWPIKSNVCHIAHCHSSNTAISPPQ